MKPKVEVIKKMLEAPCACSFRKGQTPDKNCKSCNGTGVYKDYHYIMVVGKVAYEMDTLK